MCRRVAAGTLGAAQNEINQVYRKLKADPTWVCLCFAQKAPGSSNSTSESAVTRGARLLHVGALTVS
eukprot:350556-Chlamydomonas_euryale.AAC.8